MTRTVQILICMVLVGVVGGSAVAEDSWTSSLGTYTRALAKLRKEEAALAREYPTHHIGWDLSLDEPNYVVQDYNRQPHVYLDSRQFFNRHGNRRIDYRDLSNLADDAVFPWIPFAYEHTAFYPPGQYNYPYAPYGPYGPCGGNPSYSSAYYGVRQVVPYELRNEYPQWQGSSQRGRGHTFYVNPRHGESGGHGGHDGSGGDGTGNGDGSGTADGS